MYGHVPEWWLFDLSAWVLQLQPLRFGSLQCSHLLRRPFCELLASLSTQPLSVLLWGQTLPNEHQHAAGHFWLGQCQGAAGLIRDHPVPKHDKHVLETPQNNYQSPAIYRML